MDIAELEKWLETEPGKQWLEAQKKGLLDKQAELLEKVTKGNAENKTLNERIVNLESELSKSQAVVNDTLLLKPLAQKLNEKGAFPVLVPELVKKLSEVYGLNLKDGNAVGIVKENETETEFDLDGIIDHYYKTEEGNSCFKTADTKTVQTSPDFKATPKNQDRELAAAREAAGLPPIGE